MKISKKIMTVLFGTMILVNCASGKNIVRKKPVINDIRKPIASDLFDCDGKKFTVNYITPDKVQLVDETEDKKFQLDQVVSASGVRYSDGNIEIHIKGKEAIVTRDGNDIYCTLKKDK